MKEPRFWSTLLPTVAKAAGKALLSTARERILGSSAEGEEPTRGNAPIDPHGDPQPGAAELAAEFVFLRAAALVAGSHGFGRHQDLRRDAPAAFLPTGEPPRLALFVSHRWQTPHHPDPGGAQTASVAAFMRSVAAIAFAASLAPPERVAAVPSLLVHGVFQAANLLGNDRGFVDADTSPWPPSVQQRPATEVGRAVLDRIGVWFDYSCLPQGTAESRSPATEREQQIMTTALRRLHTLVYASTVVVLRSVDDDYGARAWCVAELSIGRGDMRHLVLRTDLLGRPITEAELLGSSPPSVNNFEGTPWRDRAAYHHRQGD